MIDALNWTLALAPVLLLAVLFEWLDVFRLMDKRELLGLLLLGGLAALAAWPVSGQVLDNLPMGFTFYSRVVAPWIEEALKGAAILWLVWRNRVGFTLDAVICGFTIGAGFSVVENVFYLLRYPDLAAGVWLVRGFGTAVMHGTTTAILATIVHELGEGAERRGGGRFHLSLLWFAPGYLAASLIHLAFNQFPNSPTEVMTVTLAVAPFVLLMLLRLGARETESWLVEERAEHEVSLAAWRGGGFPDDASGRRIAALVARAGEQQGRLIRAYCQLKTELVLVEERELLDHHRHVEPDQRVALLDQLAELERLRGAIGQAGFAALQPLLPFSRHDDWELLELKHLLRHH
ncbi:PrsW family glutamic-type intramembrane protease [Sphingomonas sp.]|uniref:PrsW family glutamic-type intramembrane protease n=1 Tax=Sphingomonas sp. TaxID=28214 RepID=UPI0025E667C7|nr:PrsW family glutamic-type intramembrane protease [Sphingomonas sp.]